jgi:hypothetical protein
MVLAFMLFSVLVNQLASGRTATACRQGAS